ncbi:MAG: hypothetical protein Q7R32_12765 [Dehalococcoidia bacterium]|nr:hypothetical protein [Dehalococcoidia bacterium]
MTKKTALSAVAVAGLAAVALLTFAAGRSAYAGVLAITLDPPTATNNVGADHTVTATLTGFAPGSLVTFAVTSGPNTGATLTCSPNANCVTDANNEVSGTYTGDGGVGQDIIQACVTQIPNIVGQPQDCATATKDWVQPTPTPTPTPTPAPSPTPTQAAPAAQLPDTGTQPPDGSDFPWLLAAIVALGAFAVAGGLLLRKRAD